MLTVWFSSDWTFVSESSGTHLRQTVYIRLTVEIRKGSFWSESGCCWAFPVPAADSPDSRPARPHYSWSAGLTSGWWRRAWANSGPALQTLLSQRSCIILHNHISAIANISLSVGNVYFLCFSYQRSHPRQSLTENCCGFPRLVENTSSGLHTDAQWSSLRF